MIHPENPLQAFETLLASAGSGKAFFAFSLPGERDVSIGVGKVTDANDYHTSQPGFIVAPFRQDEGYSVILPDISICTPMTRPGALPSIEIDDPALPPNGYVESISRLTARLKTRGGKTVLSRTIDARTHGNLSVACLFHSLCVSYPESYVYCWKLPEGNIWIGAVPELLLSAKGVRIETMSLAGTQPIASSAGWDDKNREEQAIVTDYIRDIFCACGMSPESVGPFDKPAGPVKHLCTHISAMRPQKEFDALDFARRLAPTPAVCGMPVKEALEDIAATESHDRRFYGGYSGPVSGRNSCQLYVTLRCMETAYEWDEYDENHPRTLRIYVGGGITAQSTAGSEWKETRLKASTLTSLFP